MIIEAEAIKIAETYINELGYKSSSMEITIEKFDVPKNHYLEDEDDYNMIRREILKGKMYWAIYFSPKKRQFGGDVCVFVDFNTGEVLTNIRGK